MHLSTLLIVLFTEHGDVQMVVQVNPKGQGYSYWPIKDVINTFSL